MTRRRPGLSETKFAITLFIVTVAMIVIGIGFTSIASDQQNTIRHDQTQIQALENRLKGQNSTSGAFSQTGEGYTLTLVVANNQEQDFNPTLGPMPRYFVVGPNGLESSGDIRVPANTLVRLVIVNYDDGATNVTSQLATVSGTVGNSMLVFNGTSTTSTSLQVHSVPTNGTLAHSFTVPRLGLNVPVPSSSIVVAYLHTGNPGTYIWYCLSPCMPQPDMSSQKGWMTGTFTVV